MDLICRDTLFLLSLHNLSLQMRDQSLQSFLLVGFVMHELIFLIDQLSLKRVVEGRVVVADIHALILLVPVLGV